VTSAARLVVVEPVRSCGERVGTDAATSARPPVGAGVIGPFDNRTQGQVGTDHNLVGDTGADLEDHSLEVVVPVAGGDAFAVGPELAAATTAVDRLEGAVAVNL
jgi:hypothetical protein